MHRVFTNITAALLVVSFGLLSPLHLAMDHTHVEPVAAPAVGSHEPHHNHHHGYRHPHDHTPPQTHVSTASAEFPDHPADSGDREHPHSHNTSEHSVYSKGPSKDDHLVFLALALASPELDPASALQSGEPVPPTAPPRSATLPSLPALRAPPALS